MRDRIACKPRFLDPRVASTRLRCLYPISELQARDYPIELFNPERAERYGIIVYSKLYDEASYREAEALQKNGVRIVLDLCDNHFHNPNGLESLRKAGDQLRRMMALADHLVASTEQLAEVMRAELPTPRPVTVIADPVETEIRRVKTPPWEQWWEKLRLEQLLRRLELEKLKGHTPLVWFGIHGGPHGEYGMLDLLRLRLLLEELGHRFPISLTVISNSRTKYRSAIRPWRIQTHYLAWHPDTFFSALRAHSIALIPISKNPFTICKGSNRLALAVGAGMAVVADSIPSYQAFAEVCQLDNWETGLENYLSSPELRQRHVERGQAIIAKEWTLTHIADKWQDLFDQLLRP